MVLYINSTLVFVLQKKKLCIESSLCTCVYQHFCIIVKDLNPCGFAPVQVVLVRWNEPFQKLATCDMEGGIFVWIQYEGRWSVELVNDRGAQVYSHVYSLYFSAIFVICLFIGFGTPRRQ